MTIVPAWQLDTHIPPSLDHITLILEPGLAFGTGDHPTTQLCLRWLLQQRGVLGNAHVVDYGTGSGVLAIASLLLGASQAVGTDTDPLAVKASQRNGELNGVWGGLRVVQCMPSLDDEEPLAVHGLPSGYVGMGGMWMMVFVCMGEAHMCVWVCSVMYRGMTATQHAFAC